MCGKRLQVLKGDQYLTYVKFSINFQNIQANDKIFDLNLITRTNKFSSRTMCQIEIIKKIKTLNCDQLSRKMKYVLNMPCVDAPLTLVEE